MSAIIGIRSANPLDGGYIRAIYLECNRLGIYQPFAQPIMLEQVLHWIDSSLKNGIMLVAVDGENLSKVVGEVHAYPDEAGSSIFSNFSLVVDPDYLQQGVEKKLFEQFLIRLQQLGSVSQIEFVQEEKQEGNQWELFGFSMVNGAENKMIRVTANAIQTPSAN
jgi:N-acetylglutamate synthase-like GNAT family acetyltransferase